MSEHSIGSCPYLPETDFIVVANRLPGLARRRCPWESVRPIDSLESSAYVMAFELVCDKNNSPAIAHALSDMAAATRTNVARSILVFLIFSSLHSFYDAGVERMVPILVASAYHFVCFRIFSIWLPFIETGESLVL